MLTLYSEMILELIGGNDKNDISVKDASSEDLAQQYIQRLCNAGMERKQAVVVVDIMMELKVAASEK
jgi:hypothetical protein